MASGVTRTSSKQDQPRRYEVRRIEHCPIPMKDGRTLSGRVWMPETDEAVPVILEYLPYRKRDFTRPRDEPIHAYFAARGYVSVRLDLAGSGESDGLLTDEYAPQEQDDALEAIAWLSEQSWCSGPVGMFGLSWGGFNSLQIAARQPPALRAIVSAYSTDDRYADDVHFMGGCLLLDGIDWGAAFQTYLPLPPDPDVLGERWTEVWEERLAGLACPLETWVSHLRRDEYWKHGSVCEDYSQITAATLLVGGWVDGYKAAILRMAARLPAPTKCIVGPWAHIAPHEGLPGPKIGFLQEVIRWFDYWLKDIDNGVMDEPKVRAFIQDSEPPKTHYDVRQGRWIGEESWPSPAITPRTWRLTDTGLREDPDSFAEHVVPYNLAVGQFGGDWGAHAMPHELAPDQRYDDSLSLCFESEPLEAPLEILGECSLRLRVCSDKPVAMVAARLNDVHPDGAVSKVAMGLLNLAHRESSEHPAPLEPETWYDVDVRVGPCGYRFPAGHRLRVALSPSYWPVAWPSPEVVELRISGPSRITLPERTPGTEATVTFPPPEAASDIEVAVVEPGTDLVRTTTFDLAGNTISRRLDGTGAYGQRRGGGALNLVSETGTAMGLEMRRQQRIDLADPTSATTEYHQLRVLERSGWKITVQTKVLLTCTAKAFLLSCDVDVTENGRRVLARSWNPTIARDNI